MRVLSTAAAILMLAAAPAAAVPVNWTDWTAKGSLSVTGTIDVGGTAVGVSFSGPYSFANTNGGTNYWGEGSPAPYTGGNIDNAPPDSDIIALNGGGAVTISFTQAVVNPIFALVSWNGNVASFSGPIETVSAGAGYWGTGSFSNVTSNGFTGAGELHGIVRVLGNYTQVTLNHTSENWHGFQVGVEDTAAPEIPVPLPFALLGTGIAALALTARRKRT